MQHFLLGFSTEQILYAINHEFKDIKPKAHLRNSKRTTTSDLENRNEGPKITTLTYQNHKFLYSINTANI